MNLKLNKKRKRKVKKRYNVTNEKAHGFKLGDITTRGRALELDFCVDSHK